jgi:hypothetical protein
LKTGRSGYRQCGWVAPIKLDVSMRWNTLFIWGMEIDLAKRIDVPKQA